MKREFPRTPHPRGDGSAERRIQTARCGSAPTAPNDRIAALSLATRSLPPPAAGYRADFCELPRSAISHCATAYALDDSSDDNATGNKPLSNLAVSMAPQQTKAVFMIFISCKAVTDSLAGHDARSLEIAGDYSRGPYDVLPPSIGQAGAEATP